MKNIFTNADDATKRRTKENKNKVINVLTPNQLFLLSF